MRAFAVLMTAVAAIRLSHKLEDHRVLAEVQDCSIYADAEEAFMA